MQAPEVSDDELREVTPEVAALIPALVARRLRAVPLGFTADLPLRLRVAMRDPDDAKAVAELRAASGHHVVPVRAWNVQLSVVLDRLYPVVAQVGAPRAAPATKPADDWRKTPLVPFADDDVDDDERSMGTTALYLVLGAALVAGLWSYRHLSNDDRLENGSKHQYVEGRTTSAAVGISIDFRDYTWSREETGEQTEVFVKPGPGRAYGRLRFWRRAGVAPEDTDALIDALRSDAFASDLEARTCDVSDLHEGLAVECQIPGWHYFAWIEGDDMIAVRYDELYLHAGATDEMKAIVASVRPR
jgi:hypothetical protein